MYRSIDVFVKRNLVINILNIFKYKIAYFLFCIYKKVFSYYAKKLYIFSNISKKDKIIMTPRMQVDKSKKFLELLDIIDILVK